MNNHKSKPASSSSEGGADSNAPPTVIYYHHVARAPRPDHCFFCHASTLDEFRREMIHLRKHCAPISVNEMADRWERGRAFPKRALVVTFDDGFRSNLEAARLLHELSIPACFFITARTVDTTFVPSFLRFAHIISTRSVSRVTLDGRPFDLKRSVDRRRWHFRIREQLMALPPGQREEHLDELSENLASTPMPTDDPDYSFLSSDDLSEMRRLGMTIGCHSGDRGSPRHRAGYSRCSRGGRCLRPRDPVAVGYVGGSMGASRHRCIEEASRHECWQRRLKNKPSALGSIRGR